MRLRLDPYRTAAGLALILILAACRPGPTAAPPASPTVPPAAILGQIVNRVQARASTTTAFGPAVLGSGLGAGEQLQTSTASQARLDLPDGSFLRLAQDSDVTLVGVGGPGGEPVTRVKLALGKVWAGVNGSTLEVYTPAGIASIHGQRATVEFIRGDPASTVDDIIVVSCLDGDCSLQTETTRQTLAAREQIVITGGSQIARFTLTDAAFADFLAANPESARLAALVTPTSGPPGQAASPTAIGATPVATALPPGATETSQPRNTLNTPQASQTPLAPGTSPSAAPTGGSGLPAGILGRHTVQPGETLYCIGRGYAVAPEAIAQANGLGATGALSAGQVLDIPAVRWDNVPPGPVCAPQFASPYVTASATGALTPTAPVAAVTPAPSTGVAPAATATELTAITIWATPVNLSRSGSASRPAIAVDNHGNFYALWWDRIDAARLAVYQAGGDWSAAAAVPLIVGATPASPKAAPTAPNDWRIFVDGAGVLHAVWLDTSGSLFYSQRSPAGSPLAPVGSGSWTAATRLGSAVAAWDVTMNANGTLHLAFIQSAQVGSRSAGVYYLRLGTGQRSWDTPQLLAGSLYFRSLPDGAAHVSLATTDTGEVEVAWDDPQSLASWETWSTDAGQSFEAPAALAPGDTTAADQPRHLRLLPLHGGGLLRMWQRSDSCELYQQQFNPADGTWSTPARVLEQLPGCLTSTRTYLLPDGRLVMWAGLGQGSSADALVVWDSGRWSQPRTPLVSFVNPATQQSAALSCLDAALFGEQVVVVGCDGHGDVWTTTSQLSLAELLPALANAWGPPQAISEPGSLAGLPSITRDAAGAVHALWPQAQSANPGEQPLYYSRNSGDGWTPAAQILSQPGGGPANSPVIVADPRGWLHAVWSGGLNGQIYYSRALVRDGPTASGWSVPQALPSLQPAGGWPAMYLEPSGRLVVIYTIPLNENRGVYLTTSSDQGVTWSDPALIFDVAKAGWAAVQDTQLAVDLKGQLHLLVVRAPLPPATIPLGVYYLRSADGGQTWTDPAQVSGAGTGFPRLVATAHGEVHRFWVEPGAIQGMVWQQWSSDGGLSWSPPSQVPGLRNIAPSLGLASDAQGALYLVGIESVSQDSAALFYLRWDGQQWVDRQSLPLGHAADAASGATAILLPSGHLGVFYSVLASLNPGTSETVIGYAERSLPVAALLPPATIAPTASAAPTLATAPAATLTPVPTLDPAAQPPITPVTYGQWPRIIGIVGGMLLIVLVALSRLRADQRRR